MTALAAVPQPAPRYLVLGRISQAKVASDYKQAVELPIDRQMHDMLVHIERKNGIVVESYPEEGSAYEVKGQPVKRRLEFERLIADVEAERGDVVLVWKIDRLVRGHYYFQRLWEACQAHDVRIESATEPIDSSTPMGEFIIRMLVGIAKMASDDASRRIRLYLDALERAGLERLTRRRFGFAPDGVTPLTQETVTALKAEGQVAWTTKHPATNGTPIVPEFDYLKELGRRVKEIEKADSQPKNERESLSRIEQDWDERGIRSVEDKRISTAGLLCMLRNPRNESAFGGPDGHKEILRIVNDPGRRTSPGSARVHALTGRFNNDDPKNAHLCGRCGTVMRAIKGRDGKNPRFICPICGVTRQMKPVEMLARDDLFYRLESWEIQEALAAATATARSERQELLVEREPLQERLTELEEWLEERFEDPTTDADDPEVKAKLKAARKLKADVGRIDLALARQGEVVRRSRNPLLNQARKLAGHRDKLERFWDSLNAEQRHEVYVAGGLVRVVTHPVGKVGPCWSADPSKIERFWRLPNGELERIVGPSPGSREEPRPAKQPVLRQACGCGCGELAEPGRRYRQGHDPQLGERADWLAAQPKEVLCHCGCGERIPVRPWHFDRGLPRFKLGHHMRMAEFKLGYRG